MQKNINVNNQKFHEQLNRPRQQIQTFLVNNNNKIEYSQDGKRLEKNPKFIYQNKNVAAQKTFRKNEQYFNSKNDFKMNGKIIENLNNSITKKNDEIEKLKKENLRIRATNNVLMNKFNQLHNDYSLMAEERKAMEEDLKQCEDLIMKLATRLQVLDGRSMTEIMDDEDFLNNSPMLSRNRTIFYPENSEDQSEFEKLDTQLGE